MGWVCTSQCTRTGLEQTGQAPEHEAQHTLGCTSGCSTLLNQALFLFNKTTLGAHRKTGEGHSRSAQQQPLWGVSALSPDAGWVPGTHWEPPWCCRCGEQGCVLCCSLWQTAPASLQDHPTAWQGEKDIGLYS